LICDDASPDQRSQEHVVRIAQQAAAERELLYMRRESNAGFPAPANDAFAAAAPSDVVLLNSDTVVADGWLEGLREAVYVDPAIATATALTNHGTILSVPERGVSRSALPDGWSIEDAAGAVRAHSLRLRPRLLTAVGHCVYVRRSALELAGGGLTLRSRRDMKKRSISPSVASRPGCCTSPPTTSWSSITGAPASPSTAP